MSCLFSNKVSNCCQEPSLNGLCIGLLIESEEKFYLFCLYLKREIKHSYFSGLVVYLSVLISDEHVFHCSQVY